MCFFLFCYRRQKKEMSFEHLFSSQQIYILLTLTKCLPTLNCFIFPPYMFGINKFKLHLFIFCSFYFLFVIPCTLVPHMLCFGMCFCLCLLKVVSTNRFMRALGYICNWQSHLVLSGSEVKNTYYKWCKIICLPFSV